MLEVENFPNKHTTYFPFSKPSPFSSITDSFLESQQAMKTFTPKTN